MNVYEVSKLLDEVSDLIESESVEATAYNYLIDFTEGLIDDGLEGKRLVGLCIELLERIK